MDAVVVLGGQGQRLEPQRTAAGANLRRLQAVQLQLSVRVAEAVAAGHNETVGITGDQLALLPSIEEGLAARERQASSALLVARTGLGELGVDPERPELAAFPDAEQVVEQIAVLERLNDERSAAEKDLRRAETDRDAASRAKDRLMAGGEVADATALASARDTRAAALEPVYQAYLAGTSAKEPEVRALELQHLDHAIAGADAVADRLSTEAQRAAELAQARYRFQENEALAKAAERAIASLDQKIARCTETFQAAYPEASNRFPGLPSLKAAAERRRTLIEHAIQAGAALEEAERQRILYTSQRQLLDHAEEACRLEATAGLGFEARVRRAVKGLSRQAEGHAALLRDKRDLAEAELLLAEAAKQVETLEGDFQSWRERWSQALTALGLPADAKIDDAISGANEWAAAAGILTTLESTRRRLKRMDDDEAELEAWVKAVFDRLGVERPADPIAAAKMLEARWDQHQEADRKRQALEPELKLAEVQEKDHAKGVEASETELGHLAQLASVDQAGLDAVCETLKRLRDLLAQEGQLLDSLHASGDGLSEHTLRGEWGGRDVDELRAALAVELANSNSLEPALEAGVQEEIAARTHLQGQSRPAEGAAVASREAALAEIHDVVERYTKLHLARGMVETAISKVRAAQQDPLITRAGALFAAMSKGAFTGVAADVDGKGSPVVVGLAAGGRVTPVARMSDGSRDQLYLAFRLAGVESYCRSAEPLPFVADDILVHFDDERTEATLHVLSEFAQATQVLLFTHHLSVRQAAEALAKTGKVEVVQLARS